MLWGFFQPETHEVFLKNNHSVDLCMYYIYMYILYIYIYHVSYEIYLLSDSWQKMFANHYSIGKTLLGEKKF